MIPGYVTSFMACQIPCLPACISDVSKICISHHNDVNGTWSSCFIGELVKSEGSLEKN